MPRVGSKQRIVRAPVAIQRAMVTFCWLPPESRCTSAWARVSIRSRVMASSSARFSSSCRIGPQARTYQATLAIGDQTSTSSAAASGPVAALTAMLYDHGIAVETTAFHQVPAGGRTATFIQGSNGARSEWAMGLSDDPTRSALDAVIACANRLLTSA